MTRLSRVRRTDEAIILERRQSNARLFGNLVARTERLTEVYRLALKNDAQLVRSERLKEANQLLTPEQAAIEVSRQQQSLIVYFTGLQKKVANIRERLFGGQNG